MSGRGLLALHPDVVKSHRTGLEALQHQLVRSGFEEMKASPWEKEDAMHEGIPILNYHVPKAFLHENGKLTGMSFEIVRAVYDEKGRRSLIPRRKKSRAARGSAARAARSRSRR